MENALRGVLCVKGERGESAYEVAVRNGFIGSEKDFLAQLGTSSHFTRESFVHTATAGQTSVELPEAYTSNSFIDVRINGLSLNSDEYAIDTEENKINFIGITLDEGAVIEVVVITMSTTDLPILSEMPQEPDDDTTLSSKWLYENMPINVKHFGAKGDGVTDDTEAIQAAIDSAIKGSVILFEKGVYLHDTITIEKENVIINGNNTTHKLLNNDSGCFKILNSKNIIIENFIIEGNGNSDTKQYGIDSVSGNSYDNICIRNNTILNVAIGISMNADLGGHLNKIDIHNNHIENIKGENAGTGYGIHVANGNDEWSNCSIYNNSFNNCERHSIYIARGKGYLVKDNYISNHRKDIYTGELKPALNIARSSYVNVINNIFEYCYDCNISILAEENANEIYPLNSYPATNINIIGNMFSYGNNLSAIYIGYVDTTQGLPRDIIISNNSFRNAQALHIKYGYNISFKNNICTYTDRHVICDSLSDNCNYYNISENHFCTTDENGLGSAIRLQPNVCTGDTNLNIFNNTTNRIMFNCASLVSNPNISLIGDETGLSKDTGFAYKSIMINGKEY